MNLTGVSSSAGLSKMRAALQRQRRAFDARSRRERVLLILAACALCFAVADALWLSPALKVWNAARKQHQQAQSTLRGLQSDVARDQATGHAAQAQVRADVLQWRSRVRDGDTALREHTAKLVGPDRMLQVLEQMLASQVQVRVRAMQSLGKTELSVASPGAAGSNNASANVSASASALNKTKGKSPSAEPAAAAAGPALYRHGIELTLEGSFADLVSYVRAIEALPQRVAWGGMQFRVEQYPKAVLTLKLYTLSLDRHWLEI